LPVEGPDEAGQAFLAGKIVDTGLFRGVGHDR
jgi:hypothetical protein